MIDLQQKTRFGNIPRRYEIYRELLRWAKAHNGSLPNISGCHRIALHCCSINYTRFYEHFKKLESEGLIVCEMVDDIQTVYIPVEAWQAVNWDAISEMATPAVAPVVVRAKRVNLRSQSVLLRRLYKQQRGHCWWCNADLAGVYHVDHRVPLAKGGTDAEDNLCLACPNCNQKKSDKMPYEVMGRLI